MKICSLVLELFKKTLFTATILNFPERTGSIFWEPKFFYMCMLCLVNICRCNFENLFISSRINKENVVFGGHFEFPRANRRSILRTNFFKICMLCLVNIIMPLEFENLSNNSWVIQENVFGGHFEFSRANRIDFENQIFLHVHAMSSEHVPLELWKSVH